MSGNGWRNVAIALAAVCVVLWWRGRRPAPAAAAKPTAVAEPRRCSPDEDLDTERWAGSSGGASDDDGASDGDGDGDGGGGPRAFGIPIPAWLQWFAPQPGEDMLAYRDRLVPIAQAAVAPQRARVQRGRADFEQVAHLDSKQKAELDAAVGDAGDRIQEKLMEGVLSGDLMPGRFKPTTGIAYAREVLDAVASVDQRFTASLRDDQREALAGHPFDVADYLLFSVRWEDMLGAVQ